MRHLTLASKPQQRDWLEMLDDETQRAPTGHQLKGWLCGGESIPVSSALFDTSDHRIVSDLFGNDRYFADAEAFWTTQLSAIDQRAQSYRAAGWSEVVIVPRGAPFQSWEHERYPKRRGGKVYVSIDRRGAVAFHEGYISLKDARIRERQERGEEPAKPARPETTSGIRTYVDLHRHAAVRAKLVERPSLALVVMVAHAVAGSPYRSLRVEPQRAPSDPIAGSVENGSSEAAFDEKRRAVLAVLGFDSDTPTVTHGGHVSHDITALLDRLIALPEPVVLDILAIVMSETLEAGSAVVEQLGVELNVDMAKVWQADDALLDQLRDREVLDAVLAEVAGYAVAAANRRETGKVKRRIVRDCLTGDNGRAKVVGWVPRWMRFPATAYTARGGLETVSRVARTAEPESGEAPPTDLARAA